MARTLSIPTDSIRAIYDGTSTLVSETAERAREQLTDIDKLLKPLAAKTEAELATAKRNRERLARTKTILDTKIAEVNALKEAMSRRQRKIDAASVAISAIGSQAEKLRTEKSSISDRLSTYDTSDGKAEFYVAERFAEYYPIISTDHEIEYEENTPGDGSDMMVNSARQVLIRKLTVVLSNVRLRDGQGGFYLHNFGDIRFILTYMESAEGARQVLMMAEGVGDRQETRLRYGSSIHPHVSSYAGSCCMGNSPGPLITAMRTPNIRDAVLVIAEYATTYDRVRGPHVDLKHWIPNNFQDAQYYNEPLPVPGVIPSAVVTRTAARDLIPLPDPHNRRQDTARRRPLTSTCRHCERHMRYCSCDVCLACGDLLTDGTRSDCGHCYTCCTILHAQVSDAAGLGVNGSNCIIKSHLVVYSRLRPAPVPTPVPELRPEDPIPATEHPSVRRAQRTDPTPRRGRPYVDLDPLTSPPHPDVLVALNVRLNDPYATFTESATMTVSSAGTSTGPYYTGIDFGTTT